MRAVDVVAAHDDDRELERLPVAVHQHLCGGFARRIRICRGQKRAFLAVGVAFGYLAVHLVGADMYEAFQGAAVLGAVQEHVGAVHVRGCEFVAVAEAQVDVGLRGEVEDGVDGVGPEDGLHAGRRRDVAVDEGEVGPGGETARVVEGSAVVKFVEGDDVVVRVREREVADDPGGAVWGGRSVGGGFHAEQRGTMARRRGQWRRRT